MLSPILTDLSGASDDKKIRLKSQANFDSALTMVKSVRRVQKFVVHATVEWMFPTMKAEEFFLDGFFDLLVEAKKCVDGAEALFSVAKPTILRMQNQDWKKDELEVARLIVPRILRFEPNNGDAKRLIDIVAEQASMKIVNMLDRRSKVLLGMFDPAAYMVWMVRPIRDRSLIKSKIQQNKKCHERITPTHQEFSKTVSEAMEYNNPPLSFANNIAQAENAICEARRYINMCKAIHDLVVKRENPKKWSLQLEHIPLESLSCVRGNVYIMSLACCLQGFPLAFCNIHRDRVSRHSFRMCSNSISEVASVSSMPKSRQL